MRTVVAIARRLVVPLIVLAAMAGGVAALVWWPRNAGEQTEEGTWTCSMHPQVRRDGPGQCPICGMDLIPVSQLAKEKDRLAAIGVRTEPVAYRALAKELRTVGKLDYSENQIAYITARIEGRVDRVFADIVGTQVKKGDHLVEIYSPKLNVDQESLIQALRDSERLRDASSKAILQSTRERLRLLGLLPEQIEEIEQTRRTSDYLTLYAPKGGTIIEKNVRPGQYVNLGDTLYRVANLDPIWLYLDIYEADLGWIRYGQRVEVRVEAYPSEVFQGTVTLIDPFLNDQTRTVKVRVTLKNADGRLKPAMYASALIHVALQADGTPAPTGLEGKYLCPMHPEVVRDEAGRCPICGMELIRVPQTGPGASLLPAASSGSRKQPAAKLDSAHADHASQPVEQPHQGHDLHAGHDDHAADNSNAGVLSVRASAVLDTGKRQVVYRKNKDGAYELVEVTLGPRATAPDSQSIEYFPVLAGLQEGDDVVVQGGFLLDSQRQIEGMPSLLYAEGRSAASLHSGHGGSPGEPAPPTVEHKH
ncbi:MAG: efflux RND transporter periplasmic adaptor subunit [Pirellulales bacterium]